MVKVGREKGVAEVGRVRRSGLSEQGGVVKMVRGRSC